MSKGVGWLLILLGLTSCMLRPTYSRPPMDIPLDWRFEADDRSTWINVHWWEQLDDPVLNTLIFRALDNNQDLKVAIARVKEFYALLGIAMSPLFPQIDGNGSTIRQQVTADTVPPFPAGSSRTFNTYEIFGSLAYELDIWGRLMSQADAALADYLAEVEVRRGVVLTLVKNVAKAYIFLLQLDQQILVSKETYKSRVESLRLAQLRFEEGLTSELEVRQAQSEVDAAALQVVQLQVQIPQQENLLSVLVGSNPSPIVRGRALENLPFPLPVPAGLPSQLLEQRPDILEAENRLAAENARVGAARAAFFPQISLTGAYGNSSIELHSLLTSPARMWDYGLTLFQPIFEGGRLIAQLNVSKARKIEALHHYFSTILTAFKEVDDSLIAHQLSKRLLEIQKDQVKALQDYLRLATLQYQNGEIDYLSVLDAERTLFASQLNLAAAQGNIYNTLIDLYAALGGGWVYEADCNVMK